MTLLRGGAVDPLSVIIQILATLVIVFLALPLHELAHGWVAYKLGDPTAKYEGRLTLNPLASIDPMGAMFLLLFGIGWAKPVPIDSRYFKNPRSGVALTSLAGPAANLLASYVGCVIYYAIAAFAPYNAFVHYILLFFSYFSFINAVLAVFNLVPLPPLDGSKILAAAHATSSTSTRTCSMIGMLLIVSGALTGPLSVLENAVYGGVSWLAALPFRLTGVL